MARPTVNLGFVPRQLIGEVARDTSVVFLSTLAIQATAFAVIAASGLLLAAEDFARLSIILAAAMLAGALFELGLGLTVTKKYNETGDSTCLQAAFAVWLAIVPLAALLGLGIGVLASLPDIGLGIALGGLLNLWNGVRAIDQARQDYASIARSGFAFAGARLVASAAVLLTVREPVAIALALYALPMLLMPTSGSFAFAARAFAGERQPTSQFVAYATPVYLNAVAFIATPYIPQFVIAARGDPVEVGTYGLVLTFTGPISLLVYSLRGVLLPRMLGPGSQLEDMLWSRRGLALIAAMWAALLAGGVVLGIALQAVYGHKYPAIGPAFALFFAGFSATAMVGLYSLSVHTQGVPQLAMLVSCAKLLALALLLALAGVSLNATIAVTVAVMLLGELGLIAGLARGRRP